MPILNWIHQTKRLQGLPEYRLMILAKEIKKDVNYPDFKSYLHTLAANVTPSAADLLILAIKIALHSDVNVSENRLILFSGEGQQKAEKFISENDDYDVIHSRPAGAMLEILDLFHETTPIDWNEAYHPWNLLAARLTENAQGNVTSFAPELPRPAGTYRSVELGILLNNPHVKTINYKNKSHYKHLVTGTGRCSNDFLDIAEKILEKRLAHGLAIENLTEQASA